MINFDLENVLKMLKDLHIENYRLFEKLDVADLGQVNLIAGKNNTGKTALLEVLRILAADGNVTVINHILKTRGQLVPALDDSYKHLFNLNALNKDHNKLYINNLILEKNLFSYVVLLSNDLTMTSSPTIVPLNSSVTPDFPQDKSVFVPFNNPHFPLQKLWDEKIVLTPSENEVLKILKIVEPKIYRIDVKDENSKVLLEGNPIPVSLKSLGDGITRMLWIAVALASAKDSLLLIDEFEAGLHHSVQELLWEKIFYYSQEWNIQVVATTHSMDAVRTFFYVADRPENQGQGKFFRLQRSRQGPIEAVSYDHDRLEKMLELKMEPR